MATVVDKTSGKWVFARRRWLLLLFAFADVDSINDYR
jgi:hypothetical protein